jgi:CO/xanthine dehydrogenase FAD-binding subunit
MKTSLAPVFTPASLDEALALRAAHPAATVLAGGTDLMVMIEGSPFNPQAVLNLWGCPGLRGLSRRGDQLHIGALTTWLDLVRAPETPAALRDCSRTVGALPIQARGTVGGNIVNASPAGDSLPLWLAMDATFELASVRGRRTVPAAEFFQGYKKLDLAGDELLTSVTVDVDKTAGLSYRKVGTRLAQAISKVVLATRLRVEGGVVTEARVAFGSVGPTPLRCPTVEAALVGKPVDPTAAALVAQDIRPIDDIRSTRVYRLRVAENVLRSALSAAR